MTEMRLAGNRVMIRGGSYDEVERFLRFAAGEEFPAELARDPDRRYAVTIDLPTSDRVDDLVRILLTLMRLERPDHFDDALTDIRKLVAQDTSGLV
jgi:hypothetical protein